MTVTASFPLPPRDSFGNLAPMPDPFVAAVRTEIGAQYTVAAPSGSGDMLVVASDGTAIGSGTSVSFTATVPGVVIVVKSPAPGYVTMSLIDPPPGEIPDPLTLGSLITKTQPVANVLAYGADPSGATDSTAAIQAAVAAATATGGDVLLPPGAFTISGQIDVPSNVSIRGAGRGTTTVQGGVGDGATFSIFGTSSAQVENVTISDLTIDLQNVANASGIIHYYCQNVVLSRVNFINTAFKHIQSGVDTESTIDNFDLLVEGCFFGSSSASSSTETVTLANTERLTFSDCVWDTSPGTMAPVLLYQLCQAAHFERCTFDGTPIYSISCNDVTFDKCSFPNGMSGANTSDHGNFGYSYVEDLTTIACEFSGTLTLGSTRGYRDYGSTFYKTPHMGVQFGPTTGNVQGFDSRFFGTIFRDCDQDSNTWGLLYLPDSDIDLGVLLEGCVFDDDQATPTQGPVFVLASSIAYSGLRVNDCKFSGGSQLSMRTGPGTFGAQCKFSDIDGYNPTGPQTAPTMPASGTALTNPFPFDATVYVSGGTVTEVAIGGTSTGLTSGAFSVPAGESITLTYSAAPTWVWVGH